MKNAEDHAQELADHLRSVHFALMIASAVLLLGASQPIQSDYERAQRDAESIARLEADPEPIVEVVDKRIENPEPHDFREGMVGMLDPNVNARPHFYTVSTEVLIVKFVPGLIETEIKCQRPVCKDKWFLLSSINPLPSVSKITEFEVVWNRPVVHWGVMAAPSELILSCVGGPGKPERKLKLKLLEKAPSGDT